MPIEVLEPEEHVVPDLRVGILYRLTVILIGVALIGMAAITFWINSDHPEMPRDSTDGGSTRAVCLIFLVPGLLLIAHGIRPGRP